MLHGMLSVLAGFIAMSVVVMAGTMVLLAALVPGGLAAIKTMRDNPSAMPRPTPRYYALNIILSLIAAMLGGFVTAKLAGPPVRTYLMALATLILVMGLVSAFKNVRGMTQPLWYKVLIPVIGVVGVMLGGRIVQ